MKTRKMMVTISDTRYEIGKLLPDVGSFILMQMLGAGIKQEAPSGAAEGDVPRETIAPSEAVRGLAFGAFLNGLDFKQYQFIQSECLKVCCRMESPVDRADQLVPMPIVMSDGRWAIAEIRDDISLVMRLTVETLVFNLADFFEQGGLASMTPEGSTLNSPTRSTGSSGDR